MASRIGQRIIFLFLLCIVTTVHAQTIYYPQHSSDLLKITANDVAQLLTKAMPERKFTIQEYRNLPQSGFVFLYDSSMIKDQSCKIESSGSLIKFSAAQDAGLLFGIYSYLDELGFRFYLPGELWEKIPKLASPFKQINRVAVQKFKYNNWFISGGYNSWIMDKSNATVGRNGYNGQAWWQYQLRNNMGGAYRFSGHRGDIYNNEYISSLQANLCYVASSSGERKANRQSVPDINNSDAMKYWATTILKRYTDYRNTILKNPTLYKNIYRNFNYANDYIGVEVPDGAAWGNTSDNAGCATGNYDGNPYPKANDQQFLLANFTASTINNLLPEKRFQCYAYSVHANVPSTNISINKNIDVQVVASAFQTESSSIGLLNRWYKRHSNISEYDYLNIPQWTGETPIFSFENFINTLSRIKQKNGQGIVIEASPAKFASLPFLFAGNRYMQSDIKPQASIDEFTSNMFPANIAVHIKQLLKYSGEIMNGGTFINDNKYKIPLFLQELNKAVALSPNAGADVIARLQELKAYLHYIVLYYDYITYTGSSQNKYNKAANLCLYLAKTNRLQLVNSYFLIMDIARKFGVTSDFYKQFNITDGTAYQNGNLPLINNEEINNNFSKDVAMYAAAVTDYKFENPVEIISKMNAAGLKAMDKIKVGMGYTYRYDYSNRTAFYFYAPSAGKVNINCNATYEMPEQGVINFTVEAADKPLFVIKDETISSKNNLQNIDIDVPAAGLYKLSVVSKYKTSCTLIITTNGNTFFKEAFLGKTAENYRLDNFKSMPKYFYVPKIKQVYFSINNGCYTNRCLTPAQVVNIFGIKDNKGNAPVVDASPSDSSLYRMSIASENAGTFWQVTKMKEYNFAFANISNIQIFAEPKPEAAPLPVLETASLVYPNPSTGVFNFQKNNAPMVYNTVSIYDPHGKKVFERSNTSSINLSNLPAGVYIYSAQKENDIFKGKLLKN